MNLKTVVALRQLFAMAGWMRVFPHPSPGGRGAFWIPAFFGMTGFSKSPKFSESILILLFCALVLSAPNSYAEEGQQRLSEWLSGRAIAADDYPLGLVWQVPSEEAAQSKLKSELLKELLANKGEAQGRLHDWIAEMPVTGRVPVSIVDADWLSANPNHDPVIRTGHHVVLPKRPHTVTLLVSNGMRCQLPHVAGKMAMDYVRSCVEGDAKKVDWAWLVQPDGKVSRTGIARWNSQKQDQLAPGARLWIPFRDDRWADDLSVKLATFLSTQGVARDDMKEPDSIRHEAELTSTAAGNDRFFDLAVTANDWGGAGLMQTPSARMFALSHGSMTWSQTYPYTNLNFFLQPMDWMEVGFRYTSVSNRLYGPRIAGNQAYKDKSIDLKFGLIEESAYIPQVALGLRDIMGTGLFSGEYIVANKRSGQFDWSLGLGWGNVGGRGDLQNPLGLISRSFDTPRNFDGSVVGEGGTFSLSNYFHGPTALFGGVQYQSLWEPLILKLEYDGNDYQHQAQSNNLSQNSPWNVGAVYRIGDGLALTLGFERGNTFALGITLQADLKKMTTPKLDDPVQLPVSTLSSPRYAIGEATAKEIESQTGWTVRSVERNASEVRVNVDNADSTYWGEHVGRASAVLHRDAPQTIKGFSLVYRQHDMGLVEHRVDRETWVQQMTQPLPPSRQLDALTVHSLDHNGSAGEYLYAGAKRTFRFEPDLNLNYSLGGPDGFVLYQFSAEAKAQWDLREDTWMQGGLQYGLLDNFDRFRYTAPSNLPRVRTYIREYLTSSKLTMPNLQLTHVGKLTENQYYSGYAGFLERMFAGVGAEWLYRPLGSPLAFGVDINRVKQRDFNQDFGLRPYQVDTGHGTLYWDTGWSDVLAKLSAGRYLAGDAGVTVELSRIFQNGVRMGGYFTKTNVSAQQFGEGSFDKGIYVVIPFDAVLTRSTGRIGNILWKPLIRDGGAKLERQTQLFEMTKLLDGRALQYRPAELDNHIPIPSQKQAEWGVSKD